ncbi:MAG: histidinol-phosphate transaminase [Candidatus Tectomicrobia bacterium]|nr:histidinol-phosphate transaminase [Candidatus Tectomicrobia bacterium]
MTIDVPEHIATLIPYSPGKPVEELERELGITNVVKLASNENPFGPSPKAMEAVRRAVSQVHRYPDGGSYHLHQALAERHGLAPEHFLIGNGSNEVIVDIINTYMRADRRPADRGVTGEYAFLVFRLAVQSRGCTPVMVPFRDYRHDPKALLAAVDEQTRFVYVDNPNNPCGTFLRAEELDALIAALPEHCWLLLDEAYFEYVDDPRYPDGVRYVRDGRRVIVLRTFSKVFGLAGLRVGYAIADPELLSYVNRVRDPFNVNMLAQIGACAACTDTEHLERCRLGTAAGKAWLASRLGELGVDFLPTVTNFYLIRVGHGGAVYEALLREGVIVRPMGGFGLPEHIRVTIGTQEENARFMGALRRVLKRA